MTNGVSIKQPILNLPELINICTDVKVVSTVQKYFQTKNLYIGYVKVRRFLKTVYQNLIQTFFIMTITEKFSKTCVIFK